MRLTNPVILFLIVIAAITSCAAPTATPALPTATQAPAPATLTRVPDTLTTAPAAPTAQPTIASPATATPANTPPPAPTSTPTVPPTATATHTPAPTATTAATPLPVYGVNQCTEIWQPGYYKLTADIKSPWGKDCFSIGSHNVVFDCDGHSIEGDVNPKNIKGKQYGYYGFFVKKFNWPLLETPTNIEIKNCKVLHHKVAIFVGSGNNVYIHDNNLSDNRDTTDDRRMGDFLGTLTDGGGVRLDSVNGARIENNISDNADVGFDVRDSANVIIRNNRAWKNSAWGVSFLNVTNSQVISNTVRDNIRSCIWGDGKSIARGCDAGGIFLTDGASNNMIRDNQVLGDNGNGIFIKAHGQRCGDNNTIQNNKIIGAVWNAVEFSFCTGNKIIGNEIADSTDAVFFGFTKDTEIRNNVVRNMKNHGLISWNSRGSIVTGNDIATSRIGIYFYWDGFNVKNFPFLTPTPESYPSRDNLFEGNVLRDNTVAGIRLSNSIYNKVQNNTFGNNARNVWADGKMDGNVILGQ